MKEFQLKSLLLWTENYSCNSWKVLIIRCSILIISAVNCDPKKWDMKCSSLASILVLCFIARNSQFFSVKTLLKKLYRNVGVHVRILVMDQSRSLQVHVHKCSEVKNLAGNPQEIAAVYVYHTIASIQVNMYKWGANCLSKKLYWRYLQQVTCTCTCSILHRVE